MSSSINGTTEKNPSSKKIKEIDKVIRKIKGINIEYSRKRNTLLIKLFIPQEDFINILYSHAPAFANEYYLIPPNITKPTLMIEDHKFTINDVYTPSTDEYERTLIFNESEYRYKGAETEEVIQPTSFGFTRMKKVFRYGEGSNLYQENVNKLIIKELKKKGSEFRINQIPFIFKRENIEYSVQLLIIWSIYLGILIGIGCMHLFLEFINFKNLYLVVTALIILIGFLVYIYKRPENKTYLFEGKFPPKKKIYVN